MEEPTTDGQINMQTIQLTTTCVCASHETPQKEYVVYTGGIAGMSDSTDLESNPKPLQSSPDEVELHRD